MIEPSTNDSSREHVWVEKIEADSRVTGCYLVKSKKLSTTRNGNPFLSLSLGDRTGEIPAKVWDQAAALSKLFHAGDVIYVAGQTATYQGQVQLTVSTLKRPAHTPDPDVFVETSPFAAPEMMRSLKTILSQIRNEHLKALVDCFLKDRKFMALFKSAPAAKNFHHGYLGGLLEHTLSVCRLAVVTADHYPSLNKDLLIAAAFLHDVGKTQEFSWGTTIDYTDEGRLVGHIVLGITILDERMKSLESFPRELALRLRHLILSHHGQYDFGSPKEPKFPEAFALHMLDDLDAKMNGLERFMDRDRQEGSWTEYNRLFHKYLFKRPLPATPERNETAAAENHQQGMLFSHELLNQN